MGYNEAVEDGIRINNNNYGPRYLVPCCECGTDVLSWNYIRGRNYMCHSCKDRKKEELKPLKVEAKKRKPEIAIARIKQQGNNIEQYEKAILEIEKHIIKPNWFQSTEEIMVALQLYKRKIPFNHQAKIHNYIVDFILPKDKIILEVDGKLFHTKETRRKEMLRDEFIINKMGEDWEVIRVSDEDVNSHIKNLPLAIRLKYKNRQRLKCLNKSKL